MQVIISAFALFFLPFSLVQVGAGLPDEPISKALFRVYLSIYLSIYLRQEKAMLHCDLGVRWKVASDL